MIRAAVGASRCCARLLTTPSHLRASTLRRGASFGQMAGAGGGAGGSSGDGDEPVPPNPFARFSFGASPTKGGSNATGRAAAAVAARPARAPAGAKAASTYNRRVSAGRAAGASPARRKSSNDAGRGAAKKRRTATGADAAGGAIAALGGAGGGSGGAGVGASEPGAGGKVADEFIAPVPWRYRDRWRGTCEECFEASRHCPHFPEHALRLLVIGHNPSEHAWNSGFSYSHPSNGFRKLITGQYKEGVKWTGLVAPDWQITDMNAAPSDYGIGIIDIGTVPGTDSTAFGHAQMLRWRDEMFGKIRAHLKRVEAHLAEGMCERCKQFAATVAADASASSDGSSLQTTLDGGALQRSAAAPLAVAFTAKRVWAYMFDKIPSKVHSGLQPAGVVPAGWPFPPSTEVWVMPSSSGRAALTIAQRTTPYRELAERVNRVPWPKSAASHESRS